MSVSFAHTALYTMPGCKSIGKSRLGHIDSYQKCANACHSFGCYSHTLRALRKTLRLVGYWNASKGKKCSRSAIDLANTCWLTAMHPRGILKTIRQAGFTSAHPPLLSHSSDPSCLVPWDRTLDDPKGQQEMMTQYTNTLAGEVVSLMLYIFGEGKSVSSAKD